MVRGVVPESGAGFPVLEGIDVSAGLAVSVGNQRLYRKLLAKFFQGQAGFEAAFLAARAAAGEPVAAERAAHTLKGVAGNIGAMRVQQAAGELEAACRAGDDAAIAPALARTVAELTPVIAGLAVFLESSRAEKSAPRALDRPQVKALLGELGDLLSRYDAQALERAEALSELAAGSSLEGAVGELVKAVANYDFEQAGAALKNALNVLDHSTP